MTQPHPTVFFEVNLGTFEFMPACNRYLLIRIAIFDEFYLMSKSISFPDGPSDGVTHRVPASNKNRVLGTLLDVLQLEAL